MSKTCMKVVQLAHQTAFRFTSYSKRKMKQNDLHDLASSFSARKELYAICHVVSLAHLTYYVEPWSHPKLALIFLALCSAISRYASKAASKPCQFGHVVSPTESAAASVPLQAICSS